MKCPHCNKHIGEYKGKIHLPAPVGYRSKYGSSGSKAWCQSQGQVTISENLDDIDCKGCLTKFSKRRVKSNGNGSP